MVKGFYIIEDASRIPDNYDKPVDVFELISTDGIEKYTLYITMYHPRRSNKIPAGLHYIPWNKLEKVHQLLCKLHTYGADSIISDFPFGLPDAIRQSKELALISKGLGASVAKQLDEIVSKMPRVKPLPTASNVANTVSASSLDFGIINIEDDPTFLDFIATFIKTVLGCRLSILHGHKMPCLIVSKTLIRLI